MTATWNPANKAPEIILSGSDLVADKYNGVVDGGVYVNRAIATGKVAVAIACAFVSASGGSVLTYLFGGNILDPEFVVEVTPDGMAASTLLEPFDTGRPITTGQQRRFKIDGESGKVWIGNNAGFDGDPEAGTGETLSVPPGLQWHVQAFLTGNPAATATLVPTYSDGSFVSLNDAPIVEDSEMANDTITDYTEDGEIPAASGVAELAQDAPGAYTLEAPDPEAATALQLEIFSSSNYQQVVTGALDNAGSIGRLSFAKGGFCRLRAIDGAWYVQSANRGVTVG